MSRFQIVCALRLQAPQNVGAVVNQIRQQLQGIQASINISVPPNSQRQLTTMNRSIQNVSKSAKEAKSHIASFGEAAGFAGKRYLAFALVGGAIIKFGSAMKSGVKDAIDFERSMNKIVQATGASATSVRAISQEISRLGTSFGVSSSELGKAALVLAQAGLSAKDTKISLEALAKTDLAPTFESIADTTEAMIAVMQQFNVPATKMETTFSSLNAVAAKFAVESADITTAIRRTGGAFKAAGGNLNELMALFTSVRQTTRESADSIATGFRTIFTRLQRVRTQNFLKTMGIDLQDIEGQFVKPYEAVRRLSFALKDLRGTDPRFAQIIEELGGFRQISKVIPLIQRFEISEKALAVAMAGTNSLSEDAATAQSTLAVKIQKAKESFSAMMREMTGSAGFRVMLGLALQLATAFTKIVAALTPLIPLMTIFGAIGISRAIKPLVKNAGHAFGSTRTMAAGGLVRGTGNRDTVPAQLEPNSFVIRKKAVQKIGINKLANLSDGGATSRKNNRNTISALLTPGEWVVDKKKARQIGEPALNRLNYADKYADGGNVGSYSSMFQPKLTTRGKAPGNVGRKKQLLSQRLDFLKLGEKQSLLSSTELKELIKLQAKTKQAERKRNSGFADKINLHKFASGGLASSGPFDNIIPETRSNPTISLLLKDVKVQQELQKRLNLESLSFLGSGAYGVAFKDLRTGNVVRMEDDEVKRVKLPEMLQAIKTERFNYREYGDSAFTVEHLPYLESFEDRDKRLGKPSLADSRAAMQRSTEELEARVADVGYSAVDLHHGNYGLGASGKAQILDPGSIMENWEQQERVPKVMRNSPEKINKLTNYSEDRLRKYRRIASRASELRASSYGQFQINNGENLTDPSRVVEIEERSKQFRKRLKSARDSESIFIAALRKKLNMSTEKFAGGGFAEGGGIVTGGGSPFEGKIPKRGYQNSTIDMLLRDSFVQRELNKRLQVENLSFLGAGVHGIAFRDSTTGNVVRLENEDIDRLKLPEVLQAIKKESFDVVGGISKRSRPFTVEHLPFRPSLEDDAKSGKIGWPHARILKDEFQERLKDVGYHPDDAHEGNIGFNNPNLNVQKLLKRGVGKAADKLIAIDPDTFRKPFGNRPDYLNNLSSVFAKKIKALIAKKGLPELRGLRRSATGKMEKAMADLSNTAAPKGWGNTAVPGETPEISKFAKLQKIKDDAALSQNIMILAIRKKMRRGKFAEGGFAAGGGISEGFGSKSFTEKRQAVIAQREKEVDVVIKSLWDRVFPLSSGDKKIKSKSGIDKLIRMHFFKYGIDPKLAHKEIRLLSDKIFNSIASADVNDKSANVDAKRVRGMQFNGTILGRKTGMYSKTALHESGHAVEDNLKQKMGLGQLLKTDVKTFKMFKRFREKIQVSNLGDSKYKEYAGSNPELFAETFANFDNMPLMRKKLRRTYGFESGGLVPGIGNTDSVPAMLTPGELIIDKKTTKKFAAGGVVGGGGSGFSGIANAGFAFAGVSALISTFQGLNDTVDKISQTFISMGAQIVALVYVMKSMSQTVRHSNDIMQQSQERIGVLKGQKKELYTPETAVATRTMRSAQQSRNIASEKFTAAKKETDILFTKQQGQAYSDKNKRAAGLISNTAYVARMQNRKQKMQDAQQKQQAFAQERKTYQTQYTASIAQVEPILEERKQLRAKIKAEQTKIKAEERYNKNIQITSAIAGGAATAGVVGGGMLVDRGRARLEAGTGGEGDFKLGKGFVAAGTGMGVGAAAGAMFGPVGIAVGALGGAAIGTTQALLTMDKEVSNIKLMRDFGISIARTGRVLDSLNQGKTTFANSRVQVGKQTAQINEALRSRNTSTEARQDILAQSKAQLDGFNTYLSTAAKEAKTFDDFIGKAGIDTFRLIARLSNIPYDEMTEMWKKNIESATKARMSTEKLTKIQDEYANRVRNVINVGQAFENVSISMQRFDNNLDSLMGFIDGTAASFKVLDESVQLGSPEKFFNADKFNQVLARDITKNSALQTKFPGQDKNIGKAMSDEIRAAQSAIHDLPSVLLNLRNSLGQFDIETTVDKLMQSFDTAPKFVQNAIEQSARNIIGEEGKEAALIDAIKKDPAGVAKQLGESFGPIMETAQLVSSKMAEEANRRSSYLDKLNTVILKEIDLRNKGVDIQAQGEELMARAQNRPVNLSLLQKMDTNRQANILGGAGAGMLNDPVAVGNALQVAQNRLRVKEAELQKKGIDDGGKLNQEIRVEQERVNRLNMALQHLSDVSGRTSVTMQKIEKAQAKATFKQGIAEQLTFAETPGELRDLQMTLSATQKAASQGSIKGVIPNLRGEVMSMLDRIGDVKLGALGDKSGKQVKAELTADTLRNTRGPDGKAVFTADEAWKIANAQSTELEDLNVKLQSQIDLAKLANEQLSIINNATKNEIMAGYTESVASFGAEIRAIFDRQKETQLKKELGDTYSNRGRLENSKAYLSDMMSGLGTTDEMALKIGENLPVFKQYIAELKNARKLGEFIQDRTEPTTSTVGAGKMLSRLQRPMIDDPNRPGVSMRAGGKFIDTTDATLKIDRERATIAKESGGNAKVMAAFEEVMDKAIGVNLNDAGGKLVYDDVAVAITSAIAAARDAATKESMSSESKRALEAAGLLQFVPKLKDSIGQYEQLYKGILDRKTIPTLEAEIRDLSTTIYNARVDLDKIPGVKNTRQAEQDALTREIMGQGMARGGFVRGSGNKDSVHARLTPGEFVMSKEMVSDVGRESVAHFTKGGRAERRDAYFAGKQKRRDNYKNNKSIPFKFEPTFVGMDDPREAKRIKNKDRAARLARESGNKPLSTDIPTEAEMKKRYNKAQKVRQSVEQQRITSSLSSLMFGGNYQLGNTLTDEQKFESDPKKQAAIITQQMKNIQQQRGAAAVAEVNRKNAEVREKRLVGVISSPIISGSMDTPKIIPGKLTKVVEDKDNPFVRTGHDRQWVERYDREQKIIRQQQQRTDRITGSFPGGMTAGSLSGGFGSVGIGGDENSRARLKGLKDIEYDTKSGLNVSYSQPQNRLYAETIKSDVAREKALEDAAQLRRDREDDKIRENIKRGMLNTRKSINPPKFASGALVPGKGSGDTVPAMLEPGEFVIRKKAVDSIGVGQLNKWNKAKKMASGGIVGSQTTNSPMVPMDFSGFIAAANLMNTVSKDLTKTFANFNGLSLNHKFSGTLEVVLNGAAVMQSLVPNLQAYVMTEIKSALQKYVAKVPGLPVVE